EVRLHLVAPELGGGALDVPRGADGADSHPAVVVGVVAREDLVKAIAEGEAVETRGRGNQRCAGLAPAARDAAGDLVVLGGSRIFAGNLPRRAGGKRIAERLPVAQSGRAREAVVHRALVGVAELVGPERIVVGAPAAAQVLPDRGRADGVIAAAAAAAEIPVVPVEQDVEADNFQGRNVVALARLYFRRCIGIRGPCGRRQR